MNRILCLLVALAGTLALWGQGGSGVGYDPVNPPDPQQAYRLTLTCSPDKGGSVSPAETSDHSFGDQIYISASSNTGYRFRAWMEGDQVVSTSESFSITMPARNVTYTACFDRVPYDPSNPGDPSPDGYRHRVTVNIVPSEGGWTNNQNFEMVEGEKMNLYAYPNSNFRFSCWKVDGEIVSTSQELPIRMGTQNLEYTAQFVYSPSNPADPQPNLWNSATGELIIDHFSPGNLWNAITEIVGYENTGSVTSLTVIGRMDDYDMGVVRNMPQLTDADFSRTSGCTRVPGWIFENCQALTRVLLPASVRTIEYAAFSRCSNLSELVVYAAMPPAIDSDYTFYGVPESMVVKVYSSSVSIYSATPLWQNYKIATIDEDSTALTVELPDDAADGCYRNASLQLSNLTTGQIQKLLITGTRVKYVFGNLIPDVRYSLSVLAPNGTAIGGEPDFEVPQAGYTLKLTSLNQLLDVHLALNTPAGDDIAGEAAISWFDEKHALLGNGAALPGQVAGTKLVYEVSLPRESGIVYANPEAGEWTVTEGENVVSVALVAFEKREISGVLTDAVSGQPVAGGYVTVSQTLNGQYDVAANAVTDANGKYSINVYAGEGTVTAGSPDYIEVTLPLAAEESTVAAALRPLEGTEIEISLRALKNQVAGVEGSEYAAIDDFANVEFEVTNLTRNSRVEYRVRYPHLMLPAGVDEGDRIAVAARHLKGAYNTAEGETTVADGKGKVDLVFTPDGDIQIEYGSCEADDVVALLYGADGKLVRKTVFADKAAAFTGLPAGKYTVATMCDSRLFAATGSLAELAASKLAAGTDYLLNEVEVAPGIISEIAISTVPVFDEWLFYYTGSETSVSVNKTSVTVGATVTVRAKVDILPQYEGRIGRVTMNFTIPEGCDYVENSLLTTGNEAYATVGGDNRLSVDVPVRDASVRFCVVPRDGGEYRPSGTIEFELDGETVVQPIGSALFSAGDFTLSVPQETSVTRITARGGATGLSEVRVYDNDVFVGSTHTLTNGDWHLAFDLVNPGDSSEHSIRAEITTPAGVKYRTSAATTLYDKNLAELTDINMIYGGTTIDFNHVDATTAPASYAYVPGNDMFTFTTRFRQGQVEKVSSLDFVILLSDGSRRRMTAKYMPSLEAWACAIGFDDINRLPVNVKALYAETRDGELASADIADNADEPFRCPDVIPVIDPSGYVYEAVPSNRLEGVEATIFYKELAENMYGEVIEKAVKWDAEAYAQQNPLFTDAEGMYQWDVPSGEWQVRFEKEGYEVAATEWLPVPPPQLDVNVGMVQTVRPQVKEAHAYESAVTVEFDKYMIPAYLNTATIAVTVNGEKVEGTVNLLNAEEAGDETYASALRFEAAKPFDATSVTVMVSNKVMSYAGIQMEEAFVQEFTIEPEITAIQVPETVEAWVGTESSFIVTAEPAEAAAGKTLLVKIDSSVATADESVLLDAEGKAVVKFKAELPGTANVSMAVENARSVTATTRLVLAIMPDSAAVPVASIESGTVLAKGTAVALSTESEDAVIYYTVDGSSPLDSETRALYTAPIVVNADITIKAVTCGEKYLDSPIAEFTYTVQVAKAPVASVESGIVAKGTEVVLTSASEGVEIYYTLDSTSPVDSETRTLYTAPIIVNANVTILAVAQSPAYIDSEVSKFEYSVQVAEAPVASVESGIVAKGTEVALTSASEGVSIYFTTDGTSPLDSETRTLYTAPIVVTSDGTIKAVAVSTDYIESDIVEFSYTVQVAEAPVASVPTESMVDEGDFVELSTPTEGAEIYYTLDGSSPLDSPTRILYTEPIEIRVETRILAVAISDEHLPSEVAEFHYTIDPASGIDQPTASTLKVMPIASNNGFEVSGIEGRRCIVAVYNQAGTQAMATRILTEDTIVEMTEHAPGLYIVVAQCGAESTTLKLIKR